MPKVRRGGGTVNLPTKPGWSTLNDEKDLPVEQAIGKKGTPFSLANAYQNANPNYNVNYNEYSLNCQRCVVANELRRRGYDVEARAAYDKNKWSKVAKNNADYAYWKGAFRHAKVTQVKAGDMVTVMNNIENAMHKFGNGSRAVIQTSWKRGGGHVFNVENVNGRIRYIEAQSGREVDMSDRSTRMNPNTVRLVRVDDLKISYRVKEFVKPAKKR